MAEQTTDKDKESGSGGRWFWETLEWLTKLIPGLATIAVAVIAHNFQSSMSTTTLLSEREKADSQLRATMFSDLIGPIAGPNKSGGADVDRERILAELLALNFHEHFELRPLLLHVDNRLAAEIRSGSGNITERSRDSLRSVARRVTSRQISLLSKKESDEDTQAQIVHMDIVTPPPAGDKVPRFPVAAASMQLVSNFREPIEVSSPSNKYKLYLIFDSLDFVEQTVRVDISIYSNGTGEEKETAHYDFVLSWFDFPFTDNTLLADGTRFALVMDQMDDLVMRLSDDEKKTITAKTLPRLKINLIWFPQDYFAARERPTNYRQFREKLGLELK